MKQLLLFVVLLLVSCSDDTEYGSSTNPVMPISIVSEPVNQTAFLNDVTAFSVGVTGTSPSYVWYKDGVKYSTAAQCTVTATIDNDGSLFYCVVSNSKGSVTSSLATLKVIDKPDVEYNGGMVKVPAENATFAMGSSSHSALGNEAPVHEVTFTKSFWMDSVEVSQKDYYDLMTKYYPISHYQYKDSIAKEGYPVNNVSWDDAILYCNAKSEENSLTPYYHYSMSIKIDSSTILFLSDSTLFSLNSGIQKVFIKDTLVITKPDTSLVDSIVDGNVKIYNYQIVPSDTINAVPNEGYTLRNEYYLDYYDSARVVDTIFAKRDTTITNDTINDTIFIVSNYHIEDSVAGSDTTIIYPSIISDTIIAIKEGEKDSVVYGDTLKIFSNGYHLPTESQWEFAARGMIGTDFYWGVDSVARNYAWYRENSNDALKMSGQLTPNNFGLYDMSGNVWELCNDYFSIIYPIGPVVDPLGADAGNGRVIRGGAFDSGLLYIRSSQRGSVSSEAERKENVGFRTILYVE